VTALLWVARESFVGGENCFRKWIVALGLLANNTLAFPKDLSVLLVVKIYTATKLIVSAASLVWSLLCSVRLKTDFKQKKKLGSKENSSLYDAASQQ
jgi:hypothetical protein